MDYLGRATNIKLIKKINGTHSLTFQLPDKWYDSEKGDYVKNEFVEQLFNEKKVKLYYMDEWYEFYIKNVQDTKQFKSYMKTYTCSDAFIDELSRNGYGITFDEELYNNVEEIGTFSEEILKDSIWHYAPQNNWGDFTEYLEEKLYRIPISQFGGRISGYELKYNIEEVEDKDKFIINRFTKEKRNIEMGDDLASGKYFWDQYKDENGQVKNSLMKEYIESIPNDGYIYVFYSDLDFCFQTTKTELTATEEVQFYDQYSYALAPKTVDPNSLIQFMCFPENAIIEVDEAGMIVNKDYHYVMTVDQWNTNLENNSKYFYQFENLNNTKDKNFLDRGSALELSKAERQISGNWCVYYEDYLSNIGPTEVLTGKKISITNRTEINITKDIDQYVTVYNNRYNDENYIDNYVNIDGKWINDDNNIDYRVCSKTNTRQIVPQLAKNLLTNANNIKSTDGWIVAAIPNSSNLTSSIIKYNQVEKQDGVYEGSLKLIPTKTDEEKYNTFINFGLVGQKYTIKKDKIYCIGIKGEGFDLSNDKIIIGTGSIKGEGEYFINSDVIIPIYNLCQQNERYCFIQFSKTIENPYFAIILSQRNDNPDRTVYKAEFFEAYTKGIDQFNDINDSLSLMYKYSGRELFDKNITWNVEESKNIGEAKISINLSSEDMRRRVIFEDDIMPGDTYGFQEYFIQQIQATNGKEERISDTFKSKEFLSPYGNLSENQLPYSSEIFTEDDLIVSTKYINLNKCKFYNGNNQVKECDCCYGAQDGKAEKMCMYQKYGYCPYLFQTEKHCRKIRTLKGEKSNRFNLTQELGKVFQNYPVYYTEYEENGKIKKRKDKENELVKDLFFITEKGVENKIGFRYEKNLSNITRTIKSDQIVTKLYVQDVDSEISKTGLCSIKTAEDNPSKDSFIIDFSYYIAKGILNEQKTKEDLYGVKEGDFGYLKQLGYYNTQYDKLSDLIINLSSASFSELEANVSVNFDAITTAQQQLWKLKEQASKYDQINESEEDCMDFNIDDETAYDIETREKIWNFINKITYQHNSNFRRIWENENMDERIESLLPELKKIKIDGLDENELTVQNIRSWAATFSRGREQLPIMEGKNVGLDFDYKEKGDDRNPLDRTLIDKNGRGYLKILFKDDVELQDPQLIQYNPAFKIEILFRKEKDGQPYPLFKKKESQIKDSYLMKIHEQESILNELMKETFGENYQESLKDALDLPEFKIEDFSIEDFKESDCYKNHNYNFGILGQFNKEYLQIQEYRKKQAMYLRLINSLSLVFFRKYEPYLKEGTWSDSNYLTDNAYYFGAKEVSAEGAIPKVEYNITVLDLYVIEEYFDYIFNIADTTYIEDIGMFGINEKTGLPNRLKILISEITYDLDQPKNNTIKVQNFTTQFEDLFQQVSASVQSLSFNENIYKRSSNFTSNQSIKQESLQGALDSNNLTLVNTQENNISIDATGQSGSDINNHSNQYKMNGQGMFFSNNGGQSWNIGVGPNGINADYIKVGSLDAGKIRIVDNDYLYFSWDKNGIVAYRDPQSLTSFNSDDYAVFNKHGLSLVNNGKIRLRAGYEYTGKNGIYSSNDEIGAGMGFYLFDENGRSIFETQAGELSAKLKLIGEITSLSSSDSYMETNWEYKHRIKMTKKNILFQVTSNPPEKLSEDEEDSLNPSISNAPILTFEGNEFFYADTYYTPDRSFYYKEENNYYKVYGFPTHPITIYIIDEEDESQIQQIKKASLGIGDFFIEENGRGIIKYNRQKYYFSPSSSENCFLEENFSPSEIEKSNSSGVFINNSFKKRGEKGRIFSCVNFNYQGSSDNYETQNLLTVYNDGTLILGGHFDPTNDVYYYSSNPKINGDYSNTIRVIKGDIYLGNHLLSELIADASESLPSHRHNFYYNQSNYSLAYNGQSVGAIRLSDVNGEEFWLSLNRISNRLSGQTESTGG